MGIKLPHILRNKRAYTTVIITIIKVEDNIIHHIRCHTIYFLTL